MKSAILTAACLFIPVAALAQQPLEIGRVSVSEPKTIARFDTDDLKGEPVRLAWSADGKEIYVQTTERERGRVNTLARHYIFSVENGQRKSVDAEPAWFKASWAAKSDRYSPDDPKFLIDVASSTKTQRTTSVPMGGDMARGGIDGGGAGAGGGTSADDAAAAANGAQAVTVHELKLGGESIGEFVNASIVPGLTFGWGPKGSRAIAYADPKGGRIVLMDIKGKKQDVDSTKDTLLPAFSPDGTRLAWLRKDGRKAFQLQISELD
jgi:dipeptidyl aminopeptidase/acylaminoacyl peptidase